MSLYFSTAVKSVITWGEQNRLSAAMCRKETEHILGWGGGGGVFRGTCTVGMVSAWELVLARSVTGQLRYFSGRSFSKSSLHPFLLARGVLHHGMLCLLGLLQSLDIVVLFSSSS